MFAFQATIVYDNGKDEKIRKGIKNMGQFNKHQTYKRGFTIVELLIVVVIIAILAAITVVAYNGIQTRAKNSAALGTLNTFNKKIQAYQQLRGSFPSATTGLAATLDDYVESILPSSGANIGTPTATTGTNTVQVEVCGASAGNYGTGMRLTAWDYTTGLISVNPTLIGVTTACAITT